MEIAIVLLVGLGLGTLAGWFFRSRAQTDLPLMRQRAEHAEQQLQEIRQQLDQLGRQRDGVMEQLREESSRRATFEALAAGIPDLQKEIESRSLALNQHQRTLLEITTEKEALAATIEAERKAVQEKLQLLDEVKTGALRNNSEEFLKLAQASMSPIKDALGKFENKIQALEVAREGAYQGLLQQVGQLLDTGKQLRSETSNLVQALRSPIVRGQWGEIQLRRVVEMAGMLNYCDFLEQETLKTEAGMLRPDLIVKLPGGKMIVVDAKSPVSSYLDAMSATDEADRRTKLAAFARLVRERVAELGRK